MAQEHITPGTRSIGKVRYSHRGADCTLTPMENGMIKCVFDEPQRAMTPGRQRYSIRMGMYCAVEQLKR